ncbi:hypothetical protein EIP86_005403 [Pleurotus ostreatoroseus]|nr:hypothetical protein EIP86_005403 [Pleurotus ostreatoroseus]
MTQTAQTGEDESEELARFREEWRAEVRRRKQAQYAAVHGQDAKASASVSNAAAPAKPDAATPARTVGSGPTRVARTHTVLATREGTSAAAVKPTATAVTVATPPVPASVTHAHAHAKRASVDGVKHITQALESVAVSTEVKVSIRSGSGILSELVSVWPVGLAFEPEDEKVSVPLQMLPDELLVKILRYLDVPTLERFAVVDRKARVLTLDTRHLIAAYLPPVIPEDQDITALLMEKYMGNPRRMYIEHPRVRMDGVYIAVCHYIRPGLGESAWVAVSHLVTYHRYLRFYPTGQVLSLLANEGENPQQAIPKLQLTAREKCLSIGTWRLDGTTVVVSDLLEVLGDAPKYTFQMTLDLRSRPLGRWNRLALTAYETVAIADGEVTALPLKNERPFWFSKVRSYAAA